jgi:hypothetical protein
MREVSYRRIKAIDKDALNHCVENSPLASMADITPLNELVHRYDHELRQILDQVAPLRTKTIRVRVDADWYTNEIRAKKQQRRQVERLWRKSLLAADRDRYIIIKRSSS